MIKKLFSKEFITFCLIGALNTATDVGIFYLLHKAGLAILVSNTISTSIALCLSLFLNNKFTFDDGGITKKKTLKFFIVTLIGLWALQPLIIWLLTNGFDAPVILAKIVALPVTIIWNFFWYKYYVFRQKSDN